METSLPLSDKTKVLRGLRMLGFMVLMGLFEGMLGALLPPDWKTTLQNNLLYLLYVVLGMLAIEVVLTYFSKGNFLAFTADWKTQLLGLITFAWSMKTAAGIGVLLFQVFFSASKNEAIPFLMFILGVLLLAPFQLFAMVTYRKRHGLPVFGRDSQSSAA